MREILVLQIGGFGNKVGLNFWEEMQRDAYINDPNNPKDEIITHSNEVYYNLQETTLIPRCVQVDLGYDLPDSAISFNPCNQFAINQSSGNNFGFARNNCSVDILDILMDSIRMEIEQCDSPQGFQLIHSIIGGTGSGLTTKLSERLHEENPNLQQQSNVLIPSFKLSDFGVLSPYNSVLSFSYLSETVNQFIVYDNEALQKNLLRIGQEFHSYEDVNQQIAQSICCNSSPFRMPGDTNSSLRKLCNNLIPFPRLLLCTSAITNNQQSDYFKEYMKMDEAQVLREVMNPSQNQCSSDLTHGRLISAAVSIRGNVSNKELDKQIFCYNVFSKYYRNWRNHGMTRVQWMDPFFTNICRKPYQNYEMFGSSIINSSSIKESLQKIQDQFDKMHLKKSYMYLYTQEGIEEGDFLEAKSKFQDQISQYSSVSEESHIGEGEGGIME